MTVTTTRRRAAALPPGERRRMIIEAAVPLLVEHGEMVTTRQIADAAGIAEGTIFRAFADKDELLGAVIEAVLDPAPLERQVEALDPDEPLADLVRKVAAIAQKRVVDVWRVASAVGTRFHQGARRPMLESDAVVRLFEHHRDELAVAPRAAARALRGLTFAMSHPMMVERPATPREITELFLHGAAKGARPC